MPLAGAVRGRYLTLDQTRKAVPLAAADPLVYQAPLVGVWLKPGSDSVTVEEVLDHPAAWAACLRFLHCGAIAVSGRTACTERAMWWLPATPRSAVLTRGLVRELRQERVMLEPSTLLVAVFAGDREDEAGLDTDSFLAPAAPESHAFTPHFFECHCSTNGMDGAMCVLRWRRCPRPHWHGMLCCATLIAHRQGRPLSPPPPPPAPPPLRTPQPHHCSARVARLRAPGNHAAAEGQGRRSGRDALRPRLQRDRNAAGAVAAWRVHARLSAGVGPPTRVCP